MPEEERGKTITIKDIAAKSGVSICTVSRVLNKSELVGRKTRKKVEKIIDELGYIPNEMARSLLRRKSRTIALIIPDLSNPFYTELFCGIEETMSSEGYYVFVCNTNYQDENEHRYIKEMIGRGVDGMIFMSLYHCGDEIFNMVRKNVSAVAIQTKVEDMDLIKTDDVAGGREAIKYLIGLGHRKIGFVCLNKHVNMERLDGYKSALMDAGIPVREEYIVDGYVPETLGYMATGQLLDLPDPPTAIQVLNDYTAFGSYKAIMERGLRIPDDISIISYDDITMACLLNPPLTTVNQPIREMGRNAGETLLKNINSERRRLAQEIYLPTRLVIRASTAPPRE